MTTIPIRIGTSILDEIENVYDDITKRAYEIFLHRRGECALDVEDWLAAERELLCKPEAQIISRRDHFIVTFNLERTVSVLVTPDDLVVQSVDERYPRAFRTVHLPQPIDPSRLRASFVKGKLVVIALKAAFNEAFEAAPARAATRESRSVHS